MRYSILLASLTVLSGCVTSQPLSSTNNYRIEGSQAEFDEFSAERAYRGLNEHRPTNPALRLDHPVKFLEAPQPTMPPGDVEAGVPGAVEIYIVFGENGLVEQTKVVRSTRESLSRAVLEAVSQWKITPPLSRGKPTRLVARQTFNFETRE